MTNITLIRHPQTEANRDRIIQGSSDSPITELGHQQMSSFLNRFDYNKPIELIVSSPSARALDFATAFRSRYNQENNVSVDMPFVDSSFRELDWCDLEQTQHNQMIDDVECNAVEYFIDKFMSNPFYKHETIYHEAPADLFYRQFISISNIRLSEYTDVMIFGHGLTLGFLQCIMQGRSLKDFYNVKLAHTDSVTINV